MSQVSVFDVESNNPQIPTTFDADIGDAVPILNTLEIEGNVVAAGDPNVITANKAVFTVGSGNTVTTYVQISSAQAASDQINLGLASFDEASFTVDPNGFVQLVGGGSSITSLGVDTFTPLGTDPVVPNAGVIEVTGGQIANSSTANVIRTNSTVANEMKIEIQRSTTSGIANANVNGVSHYNSSQFSVDPNGFVSLAGGGLAIDSIAVQAATAPGVTPVEPNAAGLITVNGAAVANHSVVLETRSRAVNEYNIEVQYATSAAATDATKSGVAHFDSARFTVDANGFVSASTTGLLQTLTGNTGIATPVANNINVVTANATVKFVGAAATVTQDFGISNLILGSSAASIGVATNSVGLGNTALAALTNGVSNTGIGSTSLNKVNTGNENTAVGYSTLANITGGGQNVAVGASAMSGMTGGSNNVAIGYLAGSALTVGNSNNIYIGANQVGVAAENNTTRIGNTQTRAFVKGVDGVNVGSTATVVTEASDQLGTAVITAGTGITVTPGANTITIATTAGGFPWTDVSGAFSPLKENGYFITGTATGTLPASPAQGDTIQFSVDHASQVLTIQATGTQVIRMGSLVSSAAGSAVSTLQGDSVELVYRSSNTSWHAVDFVGTFVLS